MYNMETLPIALRYVNNVSKNMKHCYFSNIPFSILKKRVCRTEITRLFVHILIGWRIESIWFPEEFSPLLSGPNILPFGPMKGLVRVLFHMSRLTFCLVLRVVEKCLLQSDWLRSYWYGPSNFQQDFLQYCTDETWCCSEQSRGSQGSSLIWLEQQYALSVQE
jgi:hypothetical protein